MNEVKKEMLREDIRKCGLYDFVAKNYHRMSKEELKDLLLDFNYITYRNIDKKTFELIEEQTVSEMLGEKKQSRKGKERKAKLKTL